MTVKARLYFLFARAHAIACLTVTIIWPLDVYSLGWRTGLEYPQSGTHQTQRIPGTVCERN